MRSRRRRRRRGSSMRRRAGRWRSRSSASRWLAAPRGVPGRALGFVALLPLFVVRPAPPAPGTFRMTVLDVGQGLAVVVQTHRHALLYDTGPRYTDEADAGGRIVAPFLRAAGVAAARRHDRHAPGQRPQRRRAHAAADGARGLARVVAAGGARHPRAPRGRWRRRAALRGRPALDVGRRALRGAAADGRALRGAAGEAERPVLRRADRIGLRQRRC